MPQVAVAAAASAAVSYATGATVLGLTVLQTALVKAGVSLVLGGISQALTPKPKGNAGSGIDNRPGTVAVRQSDMTHTHVYGHVRAVRGYAHIVSTNDNKDLHLIVMLCQGPLRAINEIWVNDYAIPNDWIDSNGNVTQGRYANKMQIRKVLGTSTQLADSVAVANMPEWTTDHRLQGIAYLYVKLIKDQDVYPTGVPNISAVVEGPALFDPRIGALRWTTNIAQYAYDFITSEKGFATSGNDVDSVNISAQMNICDEIVTVSNEPFTAESVAAGTDIITLSGDLLTLQYGDRVQVTSTSSLPGGISALTDYYVIPYQIKDTPRIKLATSLLNAMAGTAIDISSAGSGTITVTKTGEPRYHGGGVFDTEQNLSQTLVDIVNSMAGRAVNIAGAWTLLAGAYRSPAIEFTIDDLRGNGVNWRNGLSMADSFNVVKGTFRGQPTLYQDTDYPAARYDTFISQDLGIEQPRDLPLTFCTRPTTAQRIAKIELFKARQDISVTADFSTKAMQVQPGDTIELTIDRYGWAQKEFEVTTFGFDIGEGGIVCKLGLRETAQAIYDWTAGEAITFDPAPNTTLTNPFNVLIPAGVSYNSNFVETRDGDAVFTIQLDWDLHPDGFVREFGDFEIQFKESDELNWRPSFFVDGQLTATDVVTATAGVFYDVRIRARNNLGVRSAWVTLEGVVVGSSGGVTVSDDWRLVSDTVSIFKDWGGVADTISTSEDWGFVA